MADNTTLNPGTGGDVIASDDIAGVKHQRVKIEFGEDGSATDVSATNPLPIKISDGTDTATVTAAGELSVSLGTAIPAGTNNIGDVDIASIAAGDNNIGNVDIVTMPNVTLAAGTNTNEVVGDAAHDAAVAGNPLLMGGYASAAAPTDVAADGRVARAWYLRNGAQATVLTAAGALIGGDASNGLDVDVTRLPALAAGTNNIGDVDVLTVPSDPFGANADAASATGSISAKLRFIASTGIPVTGTVTVAGGAAHASPVSGNPNLIAGRASNAIPTDVGADGDVASLWTNRHGAQVVTVAPHSGLNGDPWSLVHEGAQYTTTQTSTILVDAAAGEKIVVTQIQIQAYATTTFDLQVYFGTGAFSRGTNRAIFDGTFKPSSTLAPGVVMNGPFVAGTNGDDLRVTTSAAGSVTLSVWYYVIS